MPRADVSLNSGHRSRMRLKYAKLDIRELEDYELLEMLLFYAIPRADTKKLAKDLLGRYGSLAGVVNAPVAELRKCDGIGDAVAHLFKLLLDLNSRLILPVVASNNKNVLGDWNAVLNYCKLTMGYKVTQEYFRVLYLNRRNALMADECQEGTVDRVSVYPREIAKKVLEYGASAVILVHNHPSGDSKPSKEDIEVTRLIAKALEGFNVMVLDHIIVSCSEHFSFKANKLL
jgi:DNA repair protein RadC